MAADDNGSGIEADDTPPLIVKAQYIKDLSFEIPGAPEIFRRLNTEPEIEVEINVQPDDLGDGEFEVVLLVEVRATVDDEAAFVAELKYAGLFELNSSIPEEYIGSILLVECPRILFPFARNIIASATSESGMPPLMLQPIDFNAIVQAQMLQGAGTA